MAVVKVIQEVFRFRQAESRDSYLTSVTSSSTPAKLQASFVGFASGSHHEFGICLKWHVLIVQFQGSCDINMLVICILIDWQMTIFYKP